MKKRRRSYRKKKSNSRQFYIVLFLLLICFIYILFQGISGKKSLFNREKNSASKGIDSKIIRVLLTENGTESIYHSNIKICCKYPVTLIQNGRKKEIDARKVLQFSGTKKQKTVTVVPHKGKIKVVSLKRQNASPSYRGTLRIKWTKKGMLLINSLPVGEYLACVVPSEMSTSNPMEALKAQAVCARSYVSQQMKQSRYKSLGAQVDDTTRFQVYRKSGEDARSKKAVKSTENQIVCQKGNVITTYYYSTSWGCSATSTEAWGGETALTCYARKVQENKASIQGADFSEEEKFRQFLHIANGKIYDSASPWYRWKTTLSGEVLGEKLGIGTVTSIVITRREKSGLVTGIKVKGKERTISVSQADKVRSALFYPGAKIKQAGGEKISFLSILPSAAITIDSVKSGKKVNYTISGGGFGHGVGMSQVGACVMANQGKKYREILKHYYSNCSLRKQ